MAEVDPLILELRADIKSYGADLSNAQRVSEQRLGAIEARGVKMGQNLKAGFNLAKTAAIGFVASLGVETVLRAVDAGLQYAASLGEQAAQLGVTTDALQEYRYAGSQAGLATEETDQALSQLTRRIGEAASGTKAQAEAFEKLGVSVKKANGDIIDAGEAIPLIADALQNIESPAERAAILMDLFGRSGQKLEPLLSGGSKAVNGLRDAAHKLGIVLSQRQIERADETADKLDALKQVLSAKIAGAVADNADAIMSLANSLVSLVNAGGRAITTMNEVYKVLARKPQNLSQKVFGFDILGDSAGAAKFEGAYRRSQNDARFKFGNTKNPFKSVQPKYRNNLVAQAPDPFEDFRNSLAPASTAAIVLGPTKQQADLISSQLNEAQRELLPLFVDLQSVIAELTDTVEARVAAEKVQIEADKIEAIDRVNANKDLTEAEKELARQGQIALAEGKIELADRKLETAAREKSAQLAQEAADLAEIEARNRVALLEDEYDLATSVAERARIAQQIVETETKAALDAVDRQLLEQEISKEKRKELEAIRAGIVAQGKINQRRAAEGNQSASGQYLSDLRKLNFGDEADRFGVDALKELNRGLADAIVNGGNLGDVLEDTGKRFLAQLIELTFQLLVIKPLLESLGDSMGGGGGGTASVLTSAVSAASRIFSRVPARASGGPVSAGQLYRVNEAGQEFFKPNMAGQIIPMSKMRATPSGAAVSQPAVIKIYADEGAAFVPRVEAISGKVAVETVRTAAPAIRDSAVNETFRRGSRPGFR